jgi:HD superfamily phosphohydrolase
MDFSKRKHLWFEHCLGTGNLAQKYIRTLFDNHQKKSNINPEVTSENSVPENR